MRRQLRLVLLGAALLSTAGGQDCVVSTFSAPGDEMLDGDLVLSENGKFLEIPAGTPAILPGADGVVGEGDSACTYCFGDIDLVIRSGTQSISGAHFPRASIARAASQLPVAVAEPFGAGTPVPFVVGASVNGGFASAGRAIAPPSLEGAPVLAVAFADLDGDGVIGVTQLDGDAADAGIEEQELVPIGRRFALATGGSAAGDLFVEAGGPEGAPLLVALGAAAYAGPRVPGHFGGNVPNGPMVMTQLPFMPITDPDKVIDGNLPGAADPDALVGVEVEPAARPDELAHTEEWFTLKPQRSNPSIDFAMARSGAFSRFGLAQVPEPATYRALPGRPLRPGLGANGQRVVYEILQQLILPDDGAASSAHLRVVPLDRLGNVADLGASQTVTVRVGGGVRIVSSDGDDHGASSTITIANVRGAALVLDDASAGAFDDADGFVEVESAQGLLHLDVTLPDPDVDDSGFVDEADVALVEAAKDAELGDPEYDPRLDLSGNGRIRSEDVNLVKDHLGETIPVP